MIAGAQDKRSGDGGPGGGMKVGVRRALLRTRDGGGRCTAACLVGRVLEQRE